MTFATPHAAPSRADLLFGRLARELGAELMGPTNTARVLHMLTLVTSVGADLRDAHLLALARFGLSTFLFDDLADRSDLETEDLVWRAEQLCTCVTDSPAPELHYDPTARLLRQTAEELRAAGSDPRVFAHWTGAAQAAFRAMARQRVQADAQRRGEIIPLLDLREAGRDSVAIEALSATSWVLLRVPHEALGVLSAQARELALAVRLANDLRSLARDREEGAINTLSALCPSQIAAYRAELDAAAAEVLRRVDVLPLAAARAAVLDLKLCRAIVRFYGVGDFHDRLAPAGERVERPRKAA